MGSYVFEWGHPASEVIVTGTFDSWSKSTKLVKQGQNFRKKVDIPDTDKDILYKYVVDGHWQLDRSRPVKKGEHDNLNNVLKPDEVFKHPVISSAGPTSSTAALAGQQPLEKDREQTYGVAPIPATAGTGNPLTLAPGEPVPNSRDITTNTVDSSVKTDKESYEKGQTVDSMSSGTATGAAASAVSYAADSSSSGVARGNPIVDKGTPYTTAAMAGEVPKEPRGVPSVEPPKELKVESSGPFSSKALQQVAEAPPPSPPVVIQGGGPYSSKALQQVAEAPKGITLASSGPFSSNALKQHYEQSSAAAAAAAAGAAGVAGAGVAAATGVSYASDTSRSGVARDEGGTSAAGGAAAGSTTAAAAKEASGVSYAPDSSRSGVARDEGGSSAAVIGAVGAGAVVAGGAAAVGAGVMSSDEPKIADEDTMPAIAVANRDAVPPSSSEQAPPTTSDVSTKNISDSRAWVFKDDPVRAPGAAGATTSTDRDPRTVAAAFANDPIDPSSSASAPSAPSAPSSTTRAPVPASGGDAAISKTAPAANSSIHSPGTGVSGIAGAGTALPAAAAASTGAASTGATGIGSSVHDSGTAATTTQVPSTPTKAPAPAVTTDSPSTPSNKPFAASNRGREFSREISPHTDQATDNVKTSDFAQTQSNSETRDFTESPAVTSNSTDVNSTPTSKSSKRKSFMTKFKDAFKPKPGQAG